MEARYLCGHSIDVPSRNAPFIRKELCDACRKFIKQLRKEQRKRLEEARNHTSRT